MTIARSDVSRLAPASRCPNESAETPSKKKTKKAGPGFLLWWRVSSDELERQLQGYDSLIWFKAAREVSGCLLLFTAAVTALLIGFKSSTIESYSIVDIALPLVLSVFVFFGHRWAIVTAMIYWTADKGYQLFDVFTAPHFNGAMTITTVIWWCIYMHSFYLALLVENRRHLPAQAPWTR